MSVQSHLVSLASTLNLAENESTKITTSTSTLSSRINSYFGNNVTNHFRFGSSVRLTMLPRRADRYSDVDYMVIFDNANDYAPQTYLNRLKGFAEQRYHQSEIYQSSPTVVLELNHIMFELVPAYVSWGQYYIPAPRDNFTRWITTEPLAFRDELNRVNGLYNYFVKPTIRLMKYWNARKGYIYSSFEFEKNLVQISYYGRDNLKQCFYTAVRSLSTWGLSQTNTDRVNRLKDIVAEIERDEVQYPFWADSKIKEILPSP